MSDDTKKTSPETSATNGGHPVWPYGPPPPYPYPPQQDEDEIDLVEVAKTIWEGRKTIYKSVGIFLLLGLFIAFGSDEEYTAEVKLLPEINQGGSLGGLGGLARSFGINPGQQPTEGIPAELYPDITRSLVLMDRLLAYEVTIPETRTRVSLFDYYNEYKKPSLVSTTANYTVKLPLTILGKLRGWLTSEPDLTIADQLIMDEEKRQRIMRMTREEWEVVRQLRDRISASMGRESGVVTVSVKMPDAEMAADVTDQVVQYLTEYITSYRTEKARNDVEFIEERYNEAKNRFETAQEMMARFRDENRGELTAMARTQEQRLQSEYNLTFNLYNTMAERLEEARIKLQDQTPVVNILEPVAVPDQRSEPKRAITLLLAVFFGSIVGLGVLYGKAFYFIK